MWIVANKFEVCGSEAIDVFDLEPGFDDGCLSVEPQEHSQKLHRPLD